MTRYPVFSILLSLGLAACAHQAPSQQLLDARAAYAHAEASGAAVYAEPELNAARDALTNAEIAQAEGSNDQEQLALGAKRRAHIATARAAAVAAAAQSASHVQVSAQPPGSTVRVRVSQTQPQDTATQQELDATNRELQDTQTQLTAQTEALEAERLARQELQAERDAAMDKVREFALVAETQRGTVITLGGDVLFRTDESVLLPTARQKLDQVATALQQVDANQRLLIEGHADSRGSDAYNELLSAQRAQAVRDYLVSRGVSEDKLVALGRGEDEPIASNASPEGRANNRRVEIVISPAQTATR